LHDGKRLRVSLQHGPREVGWRSKHVGLSQGPLLVLGPEEGREPSQPLVE